MAIRGRTGTSLAVAAMFAAVSVVGCGDNTCTEGEAHIQECLGSDVEKEVADEECTEDQIAFYDCVLDASCDEIVNSTYVCE